MGKAKMIRNAAQADKAKQVLSMLAHKMKNGTATPEEIERYRVGSLDMVIYDWGTESYQSYIPNMIRAAEERKARAEAAKDQKVVGLIARRTMPDSPSTVPTPQGRPLLKRRAGKFAV